MVVGQPKRPVAPLHGAFAGPASTPASEGSVPGHPELGTPGSAAGAAAGTGSAPAAGTADPAGTAEAVALAGTEGAAAAVALAVRTAAEAAAGTAWVDPAERIAADLLVPGTQHRSQAAVADVAVAGTWPVA